ncbi:hypothetical protein AB5J56_42325 [Streptomyces sp. R21]|uniref:vWA-MoxR associated protein middle region 2 domain-containing protein n=1 Tax=Streptomyces sp. R21 TaxID=3238627 RepID=A0AB39PPC5_9ACTN
MTTPDPRRHVLVIAPQCAELGLLDELEEVAGSLHGLLTDQWRGGCAPGIEAAPSLLYGAEVDQARIEAAIRGAAERAGQAGAVLVLVLIGHGITPGRNSTLYLMAGNSRPDEIATAVNVGELLTQVLETPGLPGVFALVDTCHAGGAMPDLKALDGGVRQGAARLSLLMSVGAAQTAFGLAFSRGVVQVLTEGIGGADEFLRADALLHAVRDVAPGQDARRMEYDGVQPGERPWLSRNASHRLPVGSVLGPIATEQLELAVAPLGCSGLLAEPVTGRDSLETLRRSLQEHASGNTVELRWALRIVKGVIDSLCTIDLLASWPGQALTSERLRRALWSAADHQSASSLPVTSGSALRRDAVEFLRLRTPGSEDTRTARLAALVAALAAEDGLDETCRELRAWARTVDAEVELVDAFRKLESLDARMRMRLIVVTRTAAGDVWPSCLEAWLMDGGEHYDDRGFDCRPDRKAVEGRLGDVLKWASDEARKLGVQLCRVEIAASAALLLRWRPEEVRIGDRVGVAHDVVLRWSERLCPPDHLWRINVRAREKLEAMGAHSAGRAPVDWLDAQDTGKLRELRERLGNGVYRGALALNHRPPQFVRVMEVLLEYAPIVLWPCVGDCVPGRFMDSLDKYWPRLPAEFCEAYRCSWGQRTQEEFEGREHLAQWRTVWHDIEWLDFCDWFGQFTTERENSA